MDEKPIGLTIFLLKAEKVKEFEKELLGPANRIALRPPLEGFFVPLPDTPEAPKWLAAIETIVDNGTVPNMTGMSPSGILLIKRPDATFAICFGRVGQRVKAKWVEPAFGLRTALNAIPKELVIEIKAEQVLAKWHRASERAPQACPVDEFGVEFDRDLVATVEGIPKHCPSLGARVRGGTRLHLDLPLSALDAALDHSFRLFKSDDYKKDWPEIDNIIPLADEAAIEELEASLDHELAGACAAQKIVMSSPIDMEDKWELAESYIFGRAYEGAATRPYLSTDDWLSYVKKKGLTASVATAKKLRVHMVHGTKNGMPNCASFDCFGYGTSINNKAYLLSSGTWYQVDIKFIEETERLINELNQGPKLPAWTLGQKECDYNTECAKKMKYLHCDAQNFSYGGGRSKFEVCDFVDIEKRILFFVKNVTKSSGMSHLVEQVRRTAELLFHGDGDYRLKLSQKLIATYSASKLKWLEERPQQGQWNLCLVSLGRSASTFPFFAKCGLAKLLRELRSQGHCVSFVAA